MKIFDYVRKWLFAIKVCKRYGLKFKPIFTSELDGMLHWESGSYNKISVSLMHSNFYAILFHEVGHYISLKSNRLTARGVLSTRSNLSCQELQSSGFTFRDDSLYLRLVEEARASRTSLRMLSSTKLFKGSDKLLLSQALGTYNKLILELDKYGKDKSNWKVKLADIDYALHKYMLGK